MKSAIIALALLVVPCAQAGLWETGFTMDDPVRDEPREQQAALPDSTVSADTNKVAGWALGLGGALLMVIGLNRTEYVCTDKGAYTECGEEFKPNWPAVLVGAAIFAAGSALIHSKPR